MRKERNKKKITDTSKYTEPQPQQDYKNHQAKTRIESQDEVGTVEKENLEIEKQKPYQKTLDSSNTRDREENNSKRKENKTKKQRKEIDQTLKLGQEMTTIMKN